MMRQFFLLFSFCSIFVWMCSARIQFSGGKNHFESFLSQAESAKGKGKNKQNECKFECPAGKVAVPNPNHTPSSNGCGSMGITIKGPYDFTECCNKHDLCYDTCGKTQKKCDYQFKACTKRHCKSLARNLNTLDQDQKVAEEKKCVAEGESYHNVVQMFGCGSFQESQGNACQCVVEEL